MSAHPERRRGPRARAILAAIGEAVVGTDAAGRVTYLNSVAEGLTGWSFAEAAGRSVNQILPVVDGQADGVAAVHRDRLLGASSFGKPFSAQTMVRRDGAVLAIETRRTPIRDQHGAATGEVIVVRDITAASVTSSRLSYLASHDPLTELPNRRLLDDRLAQGIAMARRQKRRLAVLFLDLDGFKHINDSLGHAHGDELLRGVGRRLSACVRSSDTVGRLGGDEFVVVLPDIEHADDAGSGAQTLLSAVARPLTIARQKFKVTVTVGISVYPEDGEEAETLLKHADLALYWAKRQGGARYGFFQAVRAASAPTQAAYAPAAAPSEPGTTRR